MKSFTRILLMVVGTVFFVKTASTGPAIETAKQATNVATDMANGGIDMAKTAIDAISKMPVVSSIPGAQQMSDMANTGAGLAKGMLNMFKDMANKATKMIPTEQKQ